MYKAGLDELREEQYLEQKQLSNCEKVIKERRTNRDQSIMKKNQRKRNYFKKQLKKISDEINILEKYERMSGDN